MKSIFNTGRMFFADNAWYIFMRPGDESYHSYCHMTEVKYKIIDGIPVAGPFKTKERLIRWFKGVISHFGKNRNAPTIFIPDTLILSDRN